MKFEHFALNVTDPRAMAQWYVAQLGFQIVRRSETGTRTHFLADETGRVCLELYCNPAAPVPNYAAQHQLVLHFAVFTTDARALRASLEAAGAQFIVEETPDGSVLIMMRDPWGVALQLCQRGRPFPGF